MISCPKLREDQEQAGFTLVELMVVIVILGLMASVAVLAIPDGDDGLDRDAQTFAARTAALRDNAILQSRPMAVQVTPSGYSFLERRKGAWSVIAAKPFQSTNWSPGVSAAVGEAGPLLISFESTGLPADQATLQLTYQDVTRSIVVKPMGDVALVNDEDQP